LSLVNSPPSPGHIVKAPAHLGRGGGSKIAGAPCPRRVMRRATGSPPIGCAHGGADADALSEAKSAAQEAAMPIDATEFGSITIDGETYDHDVIIRLSGKIEKRRKRLSKEKYGTSHVISKEEAKFVFEDGCDLLVVGTGQQGNVRLSPEAEAYFDKKGCRVLLEPTPDAIGAFNQSAANKIALIHVTC
jgi:hypothetical protein